MTTAADLLDGMKRARDAVRAAQSRQRELEGLLRDAKKAVAAAQKKFELATEEAFAERRQPSLFDTAEVAPATVDPVTLELAGQFVRATEPTAEVPTWRAMTLEATGWEDEVDPDLWARITVKAFTCGELADELLRGEMFGTENLTELQPVYALVEQISSDDEAPIDFDKHFGAPSTNNPGQSEPAQKPREAFPADQAGEWEFLLQNPIRTAPADLERRELIAGWRRRQATGDTEPRWGMWSEFPLALEDGRTVQVCYKPNTFADHLEFRGEAVSETGYFSDFQRFGSSNRPQITLEAFALRRAEELAAERKPKPKKARAKKEKAKPEPVLDSPATGQQTAVALNKIDNFPDAVFDACFARGISTLPTLVEQLDAYHARIGGAGELPLRNRLVTFFVAELDCKMRPSEHAAEAVAKHLSPAAPEPDETRTTPDTAPVKGEPIEGFGLKPGQLHRVPWDDLKKQDAMKQFGSNATKPLRVDHVMLNGRPHVVLSELEHFPGPGKTWEVRPLWPEDVARNRGIAPTGADPLEFLTVEIKMGNGSLAGWVKYQVGAKREQRTLIHKPEKKPAKAKRKAGAK